MRLQRIKILLAGLALAASGQAHEGLWSLGCKAQGAYDGEPGNDYFIGPEIGYSNYYLGAHRLHLKFSYLTSRLEQVFRPNILRQDYFLFTPSWHFRRSRLFDPVVLADLGYYRYDVESEIFASLDNDSWIVAPQVGANFNFSQGQWGLFYHFGYHLILAKSTMVYPGVFGLDLWMLL